MAEIHVFGQIVGAGKFNTNGLFCKWNIVFGGGWNLIEGNVCGQTQVDYSAFEDQAFWCHPIDVHFATIGIQNWPKIIFEVWRQDFYGKSTLCSYSFCHIPSEPGFHEIKCFTWKPAGSREDQIASLFTGAGLRLSNSSTISENFERFRLQTESSGELNLELFIIFKNFEKFGIEIE
ncbi:B9 domain-containing protein 2-like protein [Dinothrombium tinctorium]|uniref:B9 domain-containing protein 2 n=1 Tax=Dinothrombium tinctorium TaxID=1965070 RepID=A0A443QNU1_9ACAR|nr:B9 domain-containing protein 2-like protein [Dinothrombium tinctorium]